MNNDTVRVVDQYAASIRSWMDIGSGERDMNKAFSKARDGADRSPEAAYLYGMFLYTGTCTDADVSKAEETFRKASEGGYEPASIVLEEMGRNPADVQANLMKQRMLAE